MLQAINYNSREYARAQFLPALVKEKMFEAVWRYLDLHKGQSVLDVGCNRGEFIQRMQNLGIIGYGVDVNHEAIADGITGNLSVMDATNLQFADETFDGLYSLHTLEHIPDVQKAISEIGRVLKPGGRLVITYPTEPWFLQGLSCLLSTVRAYGNPFLVRRIHIHSLNPRKIKQYIQGTGLVYIKTPFFAVPFYPQYLTVLEKKI